ncbi:MAG: SDR family NAD(P)-dependent oxidoreductase [Bacteroidetes bacterium]|nr:MAG: SDR family NAD(P)-dependent oxidoreductase [Bacteroidota bacterium]
MARSNWTANNIPDQKNKVIIITGSTSGIGKAGAEILAEKNATVVMAVRNTQKGESVATEIKSKFPKAKIDVRKLDLSSLDSVEQFANGFIQNYDRLDVLINNAGVMIPPYGKTADGFELQMGTNHLGHFALTGHLLPLLKNTKDSRIVATSSVAHRYGNIDFSDLGWENRKYNASRAYSDSKIANIYFMYELARKFKNTPDAPMITASHPGWTGTDLQRHSGLMRFLNIFFGQKPPQGILPSLRAAFDPEARSGDYYGPSGFMEMRGNPKKVKTIALAQDIKKAKMLWDMSEELTGVEY